MDWGIDESRAELALGTSGLVGGADLWMVDYGGGVTLEGLRGV